MTAQCGRTLAAVLMLGVLWMTIGCRSGAPARTSEAMAPAPVKQEAVKAERTGDAPLFRDVAARAGLTFRWGHKSLAGLNILDTIGHGCAFLDFDGDGKLDILLVGDEKCGLFRNKGDGSFENVSRSVLPPPPGRGRMLGCSVADYDGDGSVDILITGYGVTRLYHNRGNGTFADVTEGSGLEARGPADWTMSAAWADIDGDGRLDLYVCRYVRFDRTTAQLCDYQGLDGTPLKMACGPTTYDPQFGSLYHNEGGGRFKDITKEAGLTEGHGGNLGCLFCDFNADGKPDLYVANDRRLSDLFVNLGRGRFKNVGMSSGTACNSDGQPMSGMGVAWGDFNNDGRFDLLVATFQNEPKSLFQNDGEGLFSQQNYPSGLGMASLPFLAFGAAFIDVDNDGLLDIVLTNGHVLSEIERVDGSATYRQSSQLFRNLGNGKFSEMTTEAGDDFAERIVGRGVAVGDFDGDGKQDLLVVDDEGGPRLFHNEGRTDGHWIGLRCLHGPKTSDAIGTRVAITTGQGTQVAEVRAGGSYLSSDSTEVRFGLGKAARVDRIEIRWPDGKTVAVTDVAADRSYRIVLGETRLQ